MKRFVFRKMLAVFCALALRSAHAEHTVQLRGVMDFDGLKAALLEVNSFLPGSPNSFPSYTSTALVKEGEMFTNSATTKTTVNIKLLRVDAENMQVVVRDEGKEKTCGIPFGQGFEKGQHPGKIKLALAGAALSDLVDIYSLCSGRVVLRHPDLVTGPIAIQSAWADKQPTKSEQAGALENYFRGKDCTVIPDGKKFVLIVPTPTAKSVIPRSQKIGTVHPENVDVPSLNNATEAIQLYGKLTGRNRIGDESFPGARLYFRPLQPISKAEAVYAIEMLLKWNRIGIVLGEKNTFKAVRTPTPN